MVSCYKFIKNFIKEIDCFGTLITFQINHDYDYKSLMGGISTIIYSLFSIGYILYMSYRFFFKLDVNFIYSNKIVDSGPFINLTDIQFNFAFGVRYSDNGKSAILETKKFFNYFIYTIEWVEENDKNPKPIGIKQCEEKDFAEEFLDSFQVNDLYKMYCPIINNTVNFTLEGLYTDHYYKYMIIETRLTDYAMNNLEELYKFIEKTPLEAMIYFTDSAIDYSSKNNYLPGYINYLYKELDVTFEKKTQIFISSIEFVADENLFFSNGKKKVDSMFDNADDSFKYFRDRVALNQNMIQKFVLKASPKIIQLNRSYQKLPAFVADVSGILEEILTLILLFVNIIERKAVDRKLIQKMLKFKGSKYYDIKYMNKIFKLDEMDENIKSLINKENLTIERKGQIISNRKSINKILFERKFNLPINFPRNRTNKESIKSLTKKYNISDKIDEENLENILDSSRPIINENQEEEKNKQLLKLKDIKSESSKNNEQSDNINIENISSYKSNDEKEKNFQTFVHQNFYPKENDKLNLNIKIKNNEYEKSDRFFEIFKTEENLNHDKNKNIKQYNKDIYINEDENFGKFSLCEYICSSYFFCSKKRKMRHLIIKKCEYKIHYYLDIYTYIKKMQEIDLLKYCLFDENQMNLFKYLSTPPIKISEKNKGIYKEFEEQQVNYMKIDNKEVDGLFSSYLEIAKKNDLTFEDVKLLRLVKAEIEFLD